MINVIIKKNKGLIFIDILVVENKIRKIIV